MREVTFNVEIKNSYIVTSREAIFDFLEEQTDIDNIIYDFLFDKKLKGEVLQKAFNNLKQYIDQIFITQTNDIYTALEESICRSAEGNLINLKATTTDEIHFDIYTKIELFKKLNDKFNYNDYLDDWMSMINNKTMIEYRTDLINYYQQNPLIAWQNVDNIDEIFAND